MTLVFYPGASHFANGNHTSESSSSHQTISLKALCSEAGCGSDTTEVESVYEKYLTPFLSTIPEDRMTQGLEGLPEVSKWVKLISLWLTNSLHYCKTKQTSALWNTTAGYWAIAYRVKHAKRAAARTHDACEFTARQ